MGRNALNLILKNRVYVGETHHKGAFYPGEHDAIVPTALFEAVQQQLAERAPQLSGNSRLEQDAPYAGLLFDETGTAMLPTYTIKKSGPRYRYYASRPALKGERSRAAIHRIPAPPLEAFISGVLARFGLVDRNRQDRSLVRRIDILANSIVVHLDRASMLARWRDANRDDAEERDRDVIGRHRGLLGSNETIADDGERLTLTLPVRAKFRGGRAAVHDGPDSSATTPRTDIALVKALARAHRWRQMLLDGEATSIEAIAMRFGLDRGHVGLVLNLAFLSPDVTRAILRGEQQPGLRLTHLLATDLPLSWDQQQSAIACAAGVGAG
jgi:hypothetical protein